MKPSPKRWVEETRICDVHCYLKPVRTRLFLVVWRTENLGPPCYVVTTRDVNQVCDDYLAGPFPTAGEAVAGAKALLAAYVPRGEVRVDRWADGEQLE